VGVDAIYATQYARTQLTAQPLADMLDLDVRAIATGRSEYAREMIEVIREDHQGEVVLVVSHSNTVPELIDLLGAEPVPVIGDDEYDGLYVVTFTGVDDAVLLSLRYGRETP
jgi:broad specificity phosphatase PhoE